MVVHTTLDVLLSKMSNPRSPIPMMVKLRDGTRYPYRSYVFLMINALAAYLAEPEIIEGRRKKAKKAKVKGQVQNVRRYTLTEDGARLITRRWVIEDAEKERELKAPSSPRTMSMALHTVVPHFCRMWVRAPRADEPVLGTRQGKSGTLFLVRRRRGHGTGYARGGPVRAKRGVLVTGLDDV